MTIISEMTSAKVVSILRCLHLNSIITTSYLFGILSGYKRL